MGATHATKITEKMEKSQRLDRERKVEGQPRASSSARPLSIEGPRNTNNVESEPLTLIPNQPRQPTNLQGLLRYAMEATNSQHSANDTLLNPIDEERQRFLKEALSSLSCNIIEELQKSIKILSNVVNLCPDDDTSQQEAALEKIADYVDNIDIANDFYKIGGFSIFGPCLNSLHSSIRWRAAEVIAELAQNNPFCQEKFLETGLFPILLNIVDTDPSENARVKALYAVSCIVREYPVSLKYMDINDGYSVLLRAMQSSVKKLQIKSAFLLCSLCSQENMNNLKLMLVNMGVVEQAAGLLTTNHLLPEIRDQLLNILDGLTNSDFHPALNECRRSELCLQSTLERCIPDLEQEENPDQIDICYRLLKRVFPEQDTSQER
ncbi:PREDICTED: hsp70-binding protein 1 [Dufourea novaeangliae]|uniref:Hsp70-binding protein 1 n=1 Tax=Dufourea novaeangliae TaxID=178035 RepID=A0A154PA11_DUFNO|nr:PREDICTED: hsp70-binding protein 1 [Dufourea novaeangliae]KZC08673.1 Hsp70-binding protein 1 [Dufourea novaeangliae]